MTTLLAHFDGHVLVPEEPVDLPQGRLLRVQVEENDPLESEHTLLSLLEIAEVYPDDSGTPADLAEQHDHYLHGTPKRP
jgi:hypothetical protein